MNKEFAFPSENDEDKQYNWINQGMTLRDYFAAKALQGMMANSNWGQDVDWSDLASDSYDIADQMIKARAA